MFMLFSDAKSMTRSIANTPPVLGCQPDTPSLSLVQVGVGDVFRRSSVVVEVVEVFR